MSDRWGPGEDDTLRELAADGLDIVQIAAALGDRSPGGVYGRAKKLDIKLWPATTNRELRDFVGAGGWLLREDCGGAVGVRWTRADLSGGHFSPVTCERLWALGRLRPTDARNCIFHGVAD